MRWQNDHCPSLSIGLILLVLKCLSILGEPLLLLLVLEMLLLLLLLHVLLLLLCCGHLLLLLQARQGRWVNGKVH